MQTAPKLRRDLSITPGGLDRLSIYRYRIFLRAEERVVAPPDRFPNMLRGTFDISFRRLVCHDLTLSCRGCPLVSRCPYPAVFRPAPADGSDRLSKQQDLPRPFVFEPCPDGPEEYAPGARFEVGLTLFGERTNRLVPYFVAALRALSDRGLGSTRARLRVERVAADTPQGQQEVFEASSTTVTPAMDGARPPQLMQSGDENVRRLRVRFLTPTTLKREGRFVERPSFADLVCRVRDRVSTLAAFFGDGPIDVDFAGMTRAAEAVRTLECSTEWLHRTRRSSRTGDVHATSGFVGEAVYEGSLGPWMPLLRLGEAVHVGKYAVWGNGWIAVETAE
jgi:hypothetical protein